jgi:DNA repair exonuclease SbcCD ATPase subunit
MADEFPSGFKFNGDEQEPENLYHDELKDLRVEKLSQRVTLLAILLPCLLGVAIYFGYRDLSGRVSRGYDTESLEVQRLTSELDRLAKDFNDKLITFSTNLSTQGKDLGSSLEGRLAGIGKNIGELQNDVKSLDEHLKKTDDTVKRLTVSKADKKSQAVEVEKINAAIASLQAELDKLKTLDRDVKKVAGNIAGLESSLTKQLAAAEAIAEENKKGYTQIQDSLTKLSGSTIDQDTLALELFKLKKYFQSQISKDVTDLKQRLDTLQKEIDGLEKISGSSQGSIDPIMKKTSAPEPEGGGGTATIGQTAAAPPGTILEKDLNE